SYTVTVTNHGPLTATAVVLKNDLPALVTNPRDPPSCTFTGNSATCAIGNLAVGANVTIRFRGSVPSTASAATKLTDTATATHSKTDPLPANNTDSATITVIAAPPTTSPPPTTAPPTTAPPTTVPPTTVPPPGPQGAPPPGGPSALTGANLIT